MSVLHPTPDEARRYFRHGRVLLGNLLKSVPVRLSANTYGVHRGADVLYDNLMRLLDDLEDMEWKPPSRQELDFKPADPPVELELYDAIDELQFTDEDLRLRDSEGPADDGSAAPQPPGQSSGSEDAPAGDPSKPWLCSAEAEG